MDAAAPDPTTHAAAGAFRRTPLTRTGLVVGVAAVLLVAGGLGLRQPSLLVVGLTGLLVLLATGVSLARPPRVDVARHVSERSVRCGDPVSATVELRNRSRLLPVTGTADERALQLGVPLRLDLSVPTMPPGGSARVEYQVPTRRRGLITLGPLEFRRSDAFGLWSRSVRTGGVDDVIVRPRVHAVETELVGTTRTLDGVPRPAAPNGSVAFHSLRDYVPGDDRRTIHWRSSARRGELMVRQLVDVTQARLNVVLDTRRHAYPDPVADLDEAVEVAASVLAACASRSIATSLYGTGTLRRDVAGVDDVGDALDDLARLAADASLGLVEVGDRLEVAPGTALLVVTGSTGGLTGAADQPADDLNALRALAARHDRCLVLVIDPSQGANSAAPATPLQGNGSRDRSPGGRVLLERCPTARSALLAWTKWSDR